MMQVADIFDLFIKLTPSGLALLVWAYGVYNQFSLKKRKRAARTVLTGMCYSVGSATRQGSSSLTRFIGQSAMTSRT